MVNLELLDLFKTWLSTGSNRFYLDGIAGCGKSTQVAISLLPYYQSVNPDAVVHVVAPTHAAKKELHDKMQYLNEMYFSTVHAFVGMAPQTNEGAVDLSQLQRNRRTREAMQADLLIVDEASMSDEECAGLILAVLKLGIVKRALFLGDEHQLKPIKGKQLLVAPSDYSWHYILTKNHRSARTPDVQAHIYDLYERMQRGGQAFRYAPEETANLRYVDRAVMALDPIKDRALAFTRRGVQRINEAFTGRDHALPGDVVFSPTTKHYYRILRATSPDMAAFTKVLQARGSVLDDSSDKFRTRAFIADFLDMVEGLGFFWMQQVEASEGEWADVEDVKPVHMFCSYGTSRWKRQMDECREAAIQANQTLIEMDPEHFEGLDAEQTQEAIINITKNHYSHPAVVKRQRAWRKLYAWDQTIVCIDAPYCTTIHAAQGATHRHTYVDLEDIKNALHNGGDTYVRLLYVAMSRATDGVYILK